MYFKNSISANPLSIHLSFRGLSHTNRLVLVSIFSGLAAVFQAAGGLLPGVGYFISPLSTAPIIFCTIISKRLGVLSYVITIFLLLFLQPSELIVFPFTTGLLGLGIGMAFLMFKKRFSVIGMGSAALTLGILIVLYGLKYPLLGPVATTSVSAFTVGGTLLFASIYSWIWVEISIICSKRIQVIISSRPSK